MKEAKAVLEWYLDAGVDECTVETPRNHLVAPAPKPVPPQPSSIAVPAAASPLIHSPSAASSAARTSADACAGLAALQAAVHSFEGCALKRTATNTVFSDGNPKARIMLIGEAPGSNEDQQGIPFCGPSGQLLDRMFKAIGLTRNEIYISNTVFWRPPGNRQPSGEELAACEPFVQKHIALVAPKLLILAGGVATSALLKTSVSLSRLRGQNTEYTNPYLSAPIPTAVIYHPSYLLRSPTQKRLAWHDLLRIRRYLDEHNILN